MLAWLNRDFLELLKECETIQKRIKVTLPKNTTEVVSKKFGTLMKQGKINVAVKLLTSSMDGGVLPLVNDTMTLLQSKHPEPAEYNDDVIP